jgi:CRISPR-associated endonuclease/helicase Cas3
VLHLIAAHHGRARPHFPAEEVFDPERSQEVVAAMVRETPRRFARLQRRYGRWGLAWLESLLRAADIMASQEKLTAPTSESNPGATR